MTIEFFDAVDEVLSRGQLIAHPFVSCLSREANSLDQWRKYADDGRGFAIGFLASAIQILPISLLEVSYDREEQVREMMIALLALHSRSPSIELPLTGESFADAALIAAYMVAFKHPSFSSEREVRCLHAISLERVGANYKFADRGSGLGPDGASSQIEKVSFSIRDGALAAYVDLPFFTATSTSPIVEVALGPKNPSPMGGTFLFLGGLGYSEVTVRSSNLPYR